MSEQELTLRFKALFLACCTCTSIAVYAGMGTADARLKEWNSVAGVKWLVFFQITYAWSLPFIKSSICFTVFRITNRRRYRFILWSVMIASVLSTTVGFIAVVAVCRPISFTWDKSQDGVCAPSNIITSISYMISVLAIITDWTCAIVPTFVVWGLQMKSRVKASVCAVLALGAVASAATIIRLPYLQYYNQVNDYLHNIANIVLWSIFECGIGIIAGSLPSLRRLLKFWLDKSSKGSYNNTGSNDLRGGTVLRELKSSLKLVIAGNHDFSLDPVAFEEKIQEANRINGSPLETQLVEREFGKNGEARKTLEDAKRDGIIFLDEGTHHFNLQNGASLQVYASPYTKSSEPWGYTYADTHIFDIKHGTDIAITHSPPRGILDMSSTRARIGSEELFASIARTQPRMHCFGHTHTGWGAKLATWRPQISNTPSHFSDIDHEKSMVVEDLARLRGSKFELDEEKEDRIRRLDKYASQGYCSTGHPGHVVSPVGAGQTLFVNASIKAAGDIVQRPWVVDIDLPITKATTEVNESIESDDAAKSKSEGSSSTGSNLTEKRKRDDQLETNELKKRRLE
ncbi:cation-transporting atpase 4 [Colletotrichum karsti]|uniref:Cation-transporting atpase 4 n=1 Tax=Colletotrichum karsti TaxID=1095194 RepID=A0A9P6LJ80_9PEZI|nr:cation-transporting atpase 4 [Colletotrichum karsti]KAF9875413.1 cation-transporting atpase 4 [Colletotrichum karsti]